MMTSRFIDEISARFDEVGAHLSELAASSPARDLEKNCKAMLSSALTRLDLVSRKEFEVQRELLARALERLAELEAHVATLEASGQG
jgi:BMFP domain-containing protein YqiC